MIEHFSLFRSSRMKWKKDNKLQSLNDISKNEDKAMLLNVKKEKHVTPAAHRSHDERDP